jgi:hypothetical protein
MTHVEVYILSLRFTAHRSLLCYMRLHEIRYAQINTSHDTVVFLLTVAESEVDAISVFVTGYISDVRCLCY